MRCNLRHYRSTG